jgi:hypothetical protein
MLSWSKKAMSRSIERCATAAMAGWLLLAATGSATARPEGYRTHEQIVGALKALAGRDERCAVAELGVSGQGRALHVLTLSADPATADQRPALLIAAGLDGRHRVGTETAMRVARGLLDAHRDRLDVMTVYVIPLVNPDGAALAAGPVRVEHDGNLRAVDEDRDGRADEDGPVDLNGDGMITVMRRLDPPLDDPPTHAADPAEPRLLKTPDPMESERAVYSVYIEGLDQDGDGKVAEDGPGTVVLDKNFMHEWPEYKLAAGPYQLSEPESSALARFVLEHGNLVAAIVYGPHDTLVNTPDGKGRDVTGRGPKLIHADDVGLYKAIGELFRETTDQEHAPREPTDGSFLAWLYAQRGVPTFGTVVWGRPEMEKETEEGDETEGAGDEPPAPAPGKPSGSWTGVVEIPEMDPLSYTLTLELGPDYEVSGQFASDMFNFPVDGTWDPATGAVLLQGTAMEGVPVDFELQVDDDRLEGISIGPEGETYAIKAQRVGEPDEPDAEAGAQERPRGRDKEPKPADEEAAAWLAYSDGQRDGAGFVPWQPFDHPTLGPVEIGGFVPGFQLNPPADELDELAGKQTAFAVALMERRASLTVVGPHVSRLADGLYEVRIGLVNDGFMPTATAMVRQGRAVPPTVIRFSVPLDQIVAGDRVSRAWGIDGSGGRFALRWIVRIEDGAELTIEVESPQLGSQRIEFEAREEDQS